MEIVLQDKSYALCDNVREEETVRLSFDRLAVETFGLSFLDWYGGGWWSDRYIPHVLLKGGEVVANVSVNRMDLVVDSSLRHYIQLGTVMTRKAFRGKGLCRILMERIFEKWKEDCDGIYLFANDSVLDFYPQFGFYRETEWEYMLPVSGSGMAFQMNMEDPLDKKRLLDHYAMSNPFSALDMMNNPGLLMFYCQGGLSGQVFYVPDQDAVAIAGDEGGQRILYDVYCGSGRDLERIAAAVSGGYETVTLGFTPKDPEGKECRPHKEENTTLFFQEGGQNPMREKRCMFPALSHA